MKCKCGNKMELMIRIPNGKVGNYFLYACSCGNTAWTYKPK